MARHNQLGKQGEDAAVKFLMKNGYEILHRNWRSGHDEIDIIASRDNYLIIAEVKTRSTSFFGAPSEAVDHNKQVKLIRATESLVIKEGYDMDIRYDIVSVVIRNNEVNIEHIKDAFYPE